MKKATLTSRLQISQSAHGMWTVHLNGARNLLEQLGASETMKTNLRLRGQVAMLVWYVSTTGVNLTS